MLLIVDVALGALIVLALCLASWRGRARARRVRVRAPDLADLIPGRVVETAIPPARAPRPAPSVVDSRATWSASSERRAAAEPVAPEPGVAARVERPAVVVAPRGPSWVVRRDGASRVSSVHSARDVAVARGRKTAERERAVLEVRDCDEVVVDRTDYSAGRNATS